MILTHDRKMLSRPLEREAVLQAGARYVCIAGGKRRGELLAEMVTSQLPTVDAIIAAAPGPVLIRIVSSGVRVGMKGDWVRARSWHQNPGATALARLQNVSKTEADS